MPEPVKSHPLIFTAESVRAILAGRQTQTRQIVKPGNSIFGSAPRLYWDHCDWERVSDRVGPIGPFKGMKPDDPAGDHLRLPCHVDEPGACEACQEYAWEGTTHRLYPRWQPGERIWAKEAFARKYGQSDNHTDIVYRATDQMVTPRWKSPATMPRWASRITLEVESVRPERLQEISEADARAEGAFSVDGIDCPAAVIAAFRARWNVIHGEGAWNLNPWVFVIDFRLVTQEAAT